MTISARICCGCLLDVEVERLRGRPTVQLTWVFAENTKNVCTGQQVNTAFSNHGRDEKKATKALATKGKKRKDGQGKEAAEFWGHRGW